MAKKFAHTKNDWALGKVNGNAVAVFIGESGAIPRGTRRSLGLPYEPITAAKNALNAFVAALDRADVGEDPTIDWCFDKYVEHLEKEGKRTENGKASWKRLQSHLAGMRCSEIGQDACKGYAKWAVENGYSRATIHLTLNVLRIAIKHAHDIYEAPSRPVHKRVWNIAKPAGRDRVLTPDEFGRLLDNASAPHIRLFILLALLTTQRHAAICELTWDRVDFDKGEIDFRIADKNRDITKKGYKKGRAVVRMTPVLRAALLDAKSRATTSSVLEYEGHGRLKKISFGFNATRTRAGLGKDVTPHVLRHTGLSWAEHAGASIEDIAKLAGHKDVKTTRTIYVHPTTDGAGRAAEAVEQKMGKGLRRVK